MIKVTTLEQLIEKRISKNHCVWDNATHNKQNTVLQGLPDQGLNKCIFELK